MKPLAFLLFPLVLAAALLAQPAGITGGTPVLRQATPDPITFITVDIFIDAHQSPLAAWQLEFTPKLANGKATLVGIEGGEHAAFKQPAKYDPAALAPDGGGRVILAAFSTAAPTDLPTGRTRVARLHLQLEDNSSTGQKPGATYELTLRVAADAEGHPIDNAAATAATGDDR